MRLSHYRRKPPRWGGRPKDRMRGLRGQVPTTTRKCRPFRRPHDQCERKKGVTGRKQGVKRTQAAPSALTHARAVARTVEAKDRALRGFGARLTSALPVFEPGFGQPRACLWSLWRSIGRPRSVGKRSGRFVSFLCHIAPSACLHSDWCMGCFTGSTRARTGVRV